MTITIQVFSGADELAAQAAERIAGQVRAKADSRLLVATGQTPMATYARLAQQVQAGTLDMSGVYAAQLDEYVGLNNDDPRSLWGWMERSFVEPLKIRQVVRLHDAAAYSAELQRLGGIDLAILGLGPNGHLGFNEPPSGPDAPTRMVNLSAASLESNKAYWPGRQVPEQALTAGMDLILSARQVLLLVTGERKKEVLQQALHGPETPELPASYLRRTNLTVLADQAAWA